MDQTADNHENTNNDFIPVYVDETRRHKKRIRFPGWPAVFRYCKAWWMHPMNMALLLWLLFVAAGILLLFLLMTGILNSAIPTHSVRKQWIEITNQIVNALFTIMCLYQHPRLVHHLALLLRYRPSDAAALHSIYAGDQTRLPHERAHIALVVLLLHLTCFAQYAYCALFWAWDYHDRPDWAENLAIAVGIASPVAAWAYTMYGPLRRRKHRVEETGNDDEEYSEAEWEGGVLDCCADPPAACLSFFCGFCVFGWNMERLGLGNMYVHVATFTLLCVAPLGVFYVTALNISDDTVKFVVEVAGVVLCVFGLLYGGFWRVQMRNKFGLPGNSLCCGYPAVTDFVQWLFCWWCSLAQEVRTGNLYEVEEGSFCGKGRDVECQLPVAGVGEGRAPTSEVMDKGIEGNGNGNGEKKMSPPLIPVLNPARS